MIVRFSFGGRTNYITLFYTLLQDNYPSWLYIWWLSDITFVFSFQLFLNPFVYWFSFFFNSSKRVILPESLIANSQSIYVKNPLKIQFKFVKLLFFFSIYYRDAPPQFNGSSCGNSPSPSVMASMDSCGKLNAGNYHHLQQPNYVTPVNGLYGYERTVQSPVNNFCRFPPLLVDSSYDNDESQDPTLDQQVSKIWYCTIITLIVSSCK